MADDQLPQIYISFSFLKKCDTNQVASSQLSPTELAGPARPAGPAALIV
jgi:hypothetical protein